MDARLLLAYTRQPSPRGTMPTRWSARPEIIREGTVLHHQLARDVSLCFQSFTCCLPVAGGGDSRIHNICLWK